MREVGKKNRIRWKGRREGSCRPFERRFSGENKGKKREKEGRGRGDQLELNPQSSAGREKDHSHLPLQSLRSVCSEATPYPLLHALRTDRGCLEGLEGEDRGGQEEEQKEEGGTLEQGREEGPCCRSSWQVGRTKEVDSVGERGGPTCASRAVRGGLSESARWEKKAFEK